MLNNRHFVNALRTVLHQQAREVRAMVTGPSIRAGHLIDLSHWHDLMKEAVKPFIAEELRLGVNQGIRRLQREGLADDLHVGHLRARMRAETDAAAEKLIRETNDAYSAKLNDKVRELRLEMRNFGISGMEAKRKFTNYVYQDVATLDRAQRIAETEQVNALETGKLVVARASGQVQGKRWVCKGPNPCDRCLALNGLIVPIDEPFWVDPKGGAYAVKNKPPMHPSCLLPETTVYVPGAVTAMRTRYRGTAIGIAFSNGEYLACTPNHMLLTPFGFLAAKFLVQGDHIFRCSHGQRVSKSRPDDYYGPSMIHEVFDSFTASSRVASASVPTSPEYLHGDAALCQGDIDVVGSDRFLRNVPKIGDDFGDRPNESSFQMGNGSVGFNRFGRFAFSFKRNRLAPHGFVRRRREFLSTMLANALHANDHRFFETPGLDPCFYDETADRGPRQFKGSGNLVFRFPADVPGNYGGYPHPATNNGFRLRFLSRPGINELCFKPTIRGDTAFSKDFKDLGYRFPGQITFPRIVKIERFHYDGPVYDVSTRSSLYYIGKGMVSSNCFCRVEMVFELPKLEKKKPKRKSLDRWIDEAVDESYVEELLNDPEFASPFCLN
jgi:hypothetical protein